MDNLQKLSECWTSLTVPRDIWLHICLYLSVESLYMLRATCRAMQDIVDSRIVWLSAINDLSSINPSVYAVQDINDMTAVELREASCRIVQVHRAFSSPNLPHREIKLLTRDEMSADYTQALLFPGGERLLILSETGSFDIYDIAARKIMMHIPALKPEWHDASDRAEIFPISANVGYIVIQGSRYSIPNPKELRVYRYFGTPLNVEFILTEEIAFSAGYFQESALYHHEGELTLARLFHTDANHPTSVNLVLRTIDADGGDTRSIQKLFLDLTPDPAWQNLISLPITRILSPQFFLVLLDQQFMVFDTSKFRGHEADRDVKILCPIWKSGELIYHPANISSSLHVVPYLIDGRKPFIRVVSWEYSGHASPILKTHIVDLLLPDITAGGGGIFSSSFSLQVTPTEVQQRAPKRLRIAHGGANLGIVWLHSYSIHPSRTGPTLAIDREGLWSYTMAHTNTYDTDGAGLLRLAGKSFPQTRLGNTHESWNVPTQDEEMKGISVDSVSGRFIRFKPAFRHAGGSSSNVETAGIVLFAFDRAVDSVPTATQVMRTSVT